MFLPSENGQFAIKKQLNCCNNTSTGITIYLKQQCTDSLSEQNDTSCYNFFMWNIYVHIKMLSDSFSKQIKIGKIVELNYLNIC